MFVCGMVRDVHWDVQDLGFYLSFDECGLFGLVSPRILFVGIGCLSQRLG